MASRPSANDKTRRRETEKHGELRACLREGEVSRSSLHELRWRSHGLLELDLSSLHETALAVAPNARAPGEYDHAELHGVLLLLGASLLGSHAELEGGLQTLASGGGHLAARAAVGRQLALVARRLDPGRVRPRVQRQRGQDAQRRAAGVVLGLRGFRLAAASRGAPLG